MEPTNQVIRLADYKPHPRNYNRHPEAQVKRIQASLRKFGQVRSVVVWQGYFLAGHGVAEAARGLGWEKLRADVLPDDYPEHLALAYVAADNELARQGDPDQAQLAAILADSKAADAELLEAIGYSDKEFDELLRSVGAGGAAVADVEPQVDKADELRQKWGTELGQLWQLEGHRLICGDCTDVAVVARVMAGEKCKLVVTDPPYGVEYADKNKFLNAIARGNRIQTPIDGDHGDKKDIQATWRNAFEQMSVVMLPGAVVYCFMPQGGDQMMMMMMMMMMGAGIEPRHELIWLKNNHVLGRVDYAYKHEPILYAWKEGGHKFYGDFQTSVIECKKPQKSDLHPTTKPVELIERLVANSSQADDIVYEPFSGSGTTIIACEQLGRRCRAVEISPGYVAVALERWSTATGKTPELVTDDRLD